MVSTNNNRLGKRFVADRHFFLELMSKDKKTIINIFDKLNKIHFCSSMMDNRMFNNLMLDDCFIEVTNKKKEWALPILGAFHPEGQSNDDLHSTLVKNAIAAADDLPYETVILTTKTEKQKYEKNQHYQYDEVKEAVKICCGEEALNEIDEVYKICQRQNV